MRILVIGVSLALSGCSTVDSMTSTVGGWFGSGPAKAKPAELVEFKPAANLVEAWKVDTGDIGSYLFSPQVEGDRKSVV
jgi:outer membrane protein assembly factor BamB